MRWLRIVGVLCAGTVVLSACSNGDGGEEEGTGQEIGATAVTISADRDAVTVNGTALPSGQTQTGMPGDVVELDAAGSATIVADQALEIEALRSAKVTVPDVSADGPITLPLEVGHVFVRLDPAAAAEVVVDVGDRSFRTTTPDAEFALCQAPDGASCMAVIGGEVEWLEPDGTNAVLGAGEATFAAAGNAPDPPRCADTVAFSDMQASLRGDFEGALADIVATWEPCPESGSEVPADVGSGLPSAARMDHVELDEITIGSPDVTEDTETVLAEKTIDGTADYYIEPLSVTNGEFRSWVALTAGDDAGTWQRLVPPDWLERAPGSAATQAIYAEGTADDPVRGVTYSTASEYCAAQLKRLPTEIEWELAAVNDHLVDLAGESQDWVSDWESYGPGPSDAADRQVLRGANGVLAVDHYFRVFALDTLDADAARLYARIRCAADEVAIGGREFANVVVEDDFNSIDWPQLDEDPFELDYHPENYHLDVSDQHGQLTVLRALAEPISEGRFDIDVFVERNNTSLDDGNLRFGTVIGTADQLHTLTVQPDDFAKDSFVACVMPIDPALAEELQLGGSPLDPNSTGRAAHVGPSENHYGEDCAEADSSIEVPVSSTDNPLQIALVLTGGTLEAWVNDVLVDTVDTVPSFNLYGLYNQTFHRQRSHIHFDSLSISN